MGTIRTEIDKIQPAAWSRATVADGNWLQANTLTKLKERDDKIADLVDTELTSVKTSVATNASNIRQNSTAIESNKTEITNLKTKVTTAEGDIDALEDCTESLAKADEQIWDKIDLMDAASDVVDIYGNRAAFDAAKAEIETWITDRDIVKVLSGENDQQEYWRFLSAGGSAGGEENTWDLIGTMAPYYSTHEIDEKFDNLSVGGVKDILYTYNPDPSEHFPEASEKTVNDIYINLKQDKLDVEEVEVQKWQVEYEQLDPDTPPENYQWKHYDDLTFYTKAGVDDKLSNLFSYEKIIAGDTADTKTTTTFNSILFEYDNSGKYTAGHKVGSNNLYTVYGKTENETKPTKIGHILPPIPDYQGKTYKKILTANGYTTNGVTYSINYEDADEVVKSPFIYYSSQNTEVTSFNHIGVYENHSENNIVSIAKLDELNTTSTPTTLGYLIPKGTDFDTDTNTWTTNLIPYKKYAVVRSTNGTNHNIKYAPIDIHSYAMGPSGMLGAFNDETGSRNKTELNNIINGLVRTSYEGNKPSEGTTYTFYRPYVAGESFYGLNTTLNEIFQDHYYIGQHTMQFNVKYVAKSSGTCDTNHTEPVIYDSMINNASNAIVLGLFNGNSTNKSSGLNKITANTPFGCPFNSNFITMIGGAISNAFYFKGSGKKGDTYIDSESGTCLTQILVPNNGIILHNEAVVDSAMIQARNCGPVFVTYFKDFKDRMDDYKADVNIAGQITFMTQTWRKRATYDLDKFSVSQQTETTKTLSLDVKSSTLKESSYLVLFVNIEIPAKTYQSSNIQLTLTTLNDVNVNQTDLLYGQSIVTGSGIRRWVVYNVLIPESIKNVATEYSTTLEITLQSLNDIINVIGTSDKTKFEIIAWLI